MLPTRKESLGRSLLRISLLLLPVLAIVGVAVLGYHAVQHIDTLTFRDDYTKSEVYLSPTQLDSCLAKLSSPGVPLDSIPRSALKQCETGIETIPSLDELVKTRIDELKWILTMIGSIGAFFVIAQSAAAFFSAFLYTRQAEKTLDEIDKIQQQILARYPVFSCVEEQRSLALVDLAQDVKTSSRADNPGADPTEVMDYAFKNTLYRSMDIRKRQRILSVESFASIDLHPGPLGSDAYPDNLRRLAIFYQSKFQYENSIGFASLSDLERAEGYLRLAIEKSRGDFTLQNDLGVVCLDWLKAARKRVGDHGHEAEHFKAAAEAFQSSLFTEPRQMRAHYNLAVLAAVYGGPCAGETGEDAKKRSYREAVIHLDKALDPQIENWQRAAAPNVVKALVRYNRGCYNAWLLSTDTARTQLTVLDARSFIEDLKIAANLGGISTRVIENDFEPQQGTEADIKPAYMKAEPNLKVQLDQVKLDLLKGSTAAKPLQKPLNRRNAFRASWNVYKASRSKP